MKKLLALALCACLLLALAFDWIIRGIGRALTPWTRA